MQETRNTRSSAKITTHVMAILTDHLNLVVPSTDTDLIEAGILDSLLLVDLIISLEGEFGITVGLDQLGLENFQSVEAISRMVDQLTNENSNALAS